MIKAWWLLLLIPAAGLGFMLAAALSAGKSADSYEEGLKQGEKNGYFKGYKEGNENGLKTADILTERRAPLEDDDYGSPFDDGVGTVVIDDWEEK